MSKNLSARLNQFSSSNQENTVMRHDLYEIDRKRKLLLDEVEAIRKKKYEELDSLKRIEQQKTTLLKELTKTQEAIDKHRYHIQMQILHFWVQAHTRYILIRNAMVYYSTQLAILYLFLAFNNEKRENIFVFLKYKTKHICHINMTLI